jgi:hypothetical protein
MMQSPLEHAKALIGQPKDSPEIPESLAATVGNTGKES